MDEPESYNQLRRMEDEDSSFNMQAMTEALEDNDDQVREVVQIDEGLDVIINKIRVFMDPFKELLNEVCP